jgi:hypothetical protein
MVFVLFYSPFKEQTPFSKFDVQFAWDKRFIIELSIRMENESRKSEVDSDKKAVIRFIRIQF